LDVCISVIGDALVSASSRSGAVGHRRTVLVLGGTGFVGRNLVVRLQADARVRLLAPTRKVLDVTDAAAAERFVHGERPDVVVNCAAATGIGSIEAGATGADLLNRVVPQQWAALCTRTGTRLVHFSTDQVFPGTKTCPYDEEDAADPPSAYGATKYAGERAVLDHPAHLVLRVGMVFGAGGNTFMSRLPSLLAKTGPVTVAAGLRSSCVHVRRLCEYVAWTIDHGPRGLLHVSNRGEVTWEIFAEECVAELRRLRRAAESVSIERVTYDSMKDVLGPRPHYSVLDVSKFEQALGRPVPSWREEIPEFVQASLRFHQIPSGGLGVSS
jgi:dTDP-4-dehydrorhamnose reductase